MSLSIFRRADIDDSYIVFDIRTWIPNIFPSKIPLGKRRTEMIEMYVREKGAFKGYPLALQRQEVIASMKHFDSEGVCR